MRIGIKCIGLKLTPTIEEYVARKFARIEKLLGDTKISARVDVELERTTRHHNKGDVYLAAAELHAGKTRLRAEVKGQDLYAAIDLLKDELAHEIVGKKDKFVTKVRSGGRRLKGLMHNQ